MLLPAWRAERPPSATEKRNREGNERDGVGVHACVRLSGGVAPRTAELPRGHPHQMLAWRSLEVALEAFEVIIVPSAPKRSILAGITLKFTSWESLRESRGGTLSWGGGRSCLKVEKRVTGLVKIGILLF